VTIPINWKALTIATNWKALPYCESSLWEHCLQEAIKS
jgi:hypothetical protein